MITKLFMNGNSQAVRIPKEMQFKVKEVEINRIGNSVIITELPESWDKVFQSLDEFSEDFFKSGREQPELETREVFK
ncbi:antitoxin VapB [Allofrancisella inopinata]|uniref:Antitoxin n=1 Tax=Allofrancisella inopinata TaxID=1085647 RepID=A0AAE7CQF6_9GAMM|nr:type II toxin-antitoxin system VapB family antitoxin [Allofrancisella inopinata]QIV95717.1 antitoxin [Allofrancisella inopinata]TDT65216.1 antitoxin VapB [Allofrancisella inopinata]